MLHLEFTHTFQVKQLCQMLKVSSLDNRKRLKLLIIKKEKNVVTLYSPITWLTCATTYVTSLQNMI